MEGVGTPVAPRDRLAPTVSTVSPRVSSSVLLFVLFEILLLLEVLLPLDNVWPISNLAGAANATPNKEGGRSESDNSGFCSRCRRKCTLRLPLVVKRLRHTGHWYGRSPVCERK